MIDNKKIFDSIEEASIEPTLKPILVEVCRVAIEEKMNPLWFLENMKIVGIELAEAALVVAKHYRENCYG